MDALVPVIVSKKGVEVKIVGVPNVDIISQDPLMYINPMNIFLYIIYNVYKHMGLTFTPPILC